MEICLTKPVYRVRNRCLIYERLLTYKCNSVIKKLLTKKCNSKINPCAVDEQLRRDNFKYIQCNKQRRANLQYTEKTVKTMQEYPDEFVV